MSRKRINDIIMNKLRVILILGFVMIILPCCKKEYHGQYRNLALNRAAWHSTSYDFDLTAQLITDGIVETESPACWQIKLNGEPIKKQHQNRLFDYRFFTSIQTENDDLELEADFKQFSVQADRVHFQCRPHFPKEPTGLGYDINILVSEDGENWISAKHFKSKTFPAKRDKNDRYHMDVKLDRIYDIKACKIVSKAAGLEGWDLTTLDFYLNGEEQDIFNMRPFRSVWKSEGTYKEWLIVDLGIDSKIQKVKFNWINPPIHANILVSDDQSVWQQVAKYHGKDVINLEAYGRFVKIEIGCAKNNEQLELSELEIWGVNELKMPESNWKVVRENLASRDEMWLPANVPGTVLTSYIDCGAVPDPSWANNNSMISDSYFRSNFIYKGILKGPEKTADKVYLCFDGINWKADVTLNGTHLESIKGAFIRTKYDVTDIVKKGDNLIEVKIHCNDNPSSGKGNTMETNEFNGGILGADNPTFHASIGWDWIPSVHGRNIGIWNDVYFATSGNVCINHPFVSSKLNLPDTTNAKVTITAELINRGNSATNAKWDGKFGNIPFSQEVELQPGEKKIVKAELEIPNPKLWWPNGYGEQNLYDVSMNTLVGNVETDSKSFKTGIRENTYSTDGGHLTVWVNGRRFSGRGGNWGFSEYNLRYRGKEYDTAVRLHAEENFTMIRNWVGQTMDDEFYEACDKYGIMVWQDFWLANPLDGPDPYDEEMFMANLNDLLLRIRNHPSIVLYVGRNEGVPPVSLDNAFRNSIAKYHPEIFYIPDSSHGLVGGNGEYHRMTALDFFKQWYENPELWGQDRVHSEKGMPNVPNYESFIKFIPEDSYWPQNEMWAYHDWTQNSAQRVSTFNSAVWNMFGEPQNAKQFCEWAQWVNYDGYRAIFESRSEQRRGLTLWMSHAAWPTFVWCTYDYYFDPTGAYFGCKKANEPIHIMWNPLKKCVEVVNISAKDRTNLQAEAKVLDMYGRILNTKQVTIDIKEDSTASCFNLEAPSNQSVYYYSLALKEGKDVISENFYVLGAETDNFKALHKLPKAMLSIDSNSELINGQWVVTYTISNKGKVPAMMLKLTARKGEEGDRILPIHYSDNYFHLMPNGESKTITITADEVDCGEEEPYIELTGFNL